ncbi:hypothetical protein GWO43_04915 [candidate division KSB1 bacterium]|nr:hypothetical protein [candidate division KSB1 bacterium]NIR71425.1 hypothetical protein [candidate division KSB1 bacterium]NIS23346.1 hypothetical protein [candidate division KSB1 bacterium]NIT70237.1 hypothetical protein [candidate division KSB1 bacterium]NIU23960.1 hypothetical protein [candidate division KSB1 bacterium]
MKKKILISLSIFCVSQLCAQEIDSVRAMKLVELQATIDSLHQRMQALQGELQKLKTQIQEGAQLDQLLAVFNQEDDESVPADQRSRRKRVDALLKAITDRPGQLRFNGGATTTLQGDPSGDDRFVTGVGSFDIFAHTSFGQNTLLFLDIEAIGGNGPNTRIATFSSLNEDAGSTAGSDGLDRLRILEAWAEFTAFDEWLKITAGKIDLTNYFDNNASANDETSQFISGAFVNSAAFPVPDNAPGIRLRTTVFNRFFVQFALSSIDDSGNDLFDELFKIGSVGFKLFPETGWEANLRLYGYQQASADNSMGFGVSFDESIAREFHIFARYNQNESELAEWFGISSAWSSGARFVKHFFEREIAIGLAYGETTPDNETLDDEKLLEIYARHQMNKWVYVSPHLQIVRNAAGTSEQRTFLGLRTHFNF